MTMLRRPASDEYHPYYATYIRLVDPDGLARDLRDGARRVTSLLENVPDDEAARPPAPGKWNLKQVVGHLSDTERVFAFRLLWTLRGDAAPLPGFDQDVWATARNVDGSTLGDLLAEFEAVRTATLHLLHGTRDEDFDRRVVASGHAVTARALVWMIVGHARHHENTLSTLRDQFASASSEAR